jgi:hypothetical protein
VRVTSFYSFIAKNQGGFRYQREPRILSTSSGDATFATLPTTDQWLIIDDDDDGDPFLITTLPATADVFDGPGATLAAGALDYSIDFDALFGRSSQEWEALTLQPGETLALMRFVTEQTSRAAARASAERLVQLPPEALTGLSPIEVTQIRNFKLPPNGVSPLSALSPLVGTVRGMALAADGVMAVPNANLRFRSSSPFFGRTHSRTTDGDGRFSFVGGLNDSGSSTAIPVADFTLLATDGLTGEVSPEASGSFGDGLLVVDQNVIFSNSGILFGTVSRAGGEVVTVGNVTLSGGALLNVISSGLSGDGTYLFRVVPPGTYTATATLPIPDGTDLSAAVSTSLTAGGTTRTDIVLPQTGGVVGTLFTGAGDAGVNQPIYLQGNQFQRQVQTGTGGQFSFLDVPIGSFTVSAYEPHTGVISVSNAVVLADSILTQNLRFIGLGVVHLKATLAGGAAAIRAPVQISEFARGSSFRSVGNTDLNGELLLSDVPQGLFTLRVLNPGNTALFSQINGSIVSDAQIVEAVAVVPMDAPPIVTLLAPLAGTNVIEGARISLSASASDDIGIRYVEFIVDGQSMASDFSAPFSAIVTLPLVSVDRDLIITALAVDTGTNRSQSSVTIRVLDDTQPPTVTLVEPANNATVKEGTAITLRATANDNVALSRVEFSAEGVPFGNDPTSPYTWVYTIPSDYARLGPKKLLLAATAYDASSLHRTSIVTLNVISDDPPRVTVTAPGNGTRIVEGSAFTVAATAADDVGVALVEFFVDGAFVGADVSAPYTNRFQITSGIGDSTVLVEAVATDTLGQRATNAVSVVRLNDTNAPRVTIAAPADGSIVTVGDSDIAIIVDDSGSTSSSSGADVDGDGRTDSILKAEVFSGLQLLNFLNPTNTRVSIVVFNTSATLRQSLTNNFTVARQVLTNVLIAGPTGLTDFNNAMRVATDELAGLRARRSATAVQLFLSDGTASYPATEVTRASLGGICVNTFAVGSGANPTILRQIATNTSCVFTPVVNPSELVRILPRIILFGINQLAVVADAVDDVALRSVDFSVASSVGTFSSADTSEPFQILFGLPVLTNSLSLTLLATATDFGDNRVVSSPVRVTLLPAENGPQVNRLTPSSGRAGTNVTILGKFFHPIPTNNVVTFNGLRAKVVSGNKISLMVQVPAGATTGPVIVESEGLQSSGIAFTLLQPGAVAVAEMDAESLDEGPVASNLDEAELVPIELLDISLKNGIFRCSISTVVGKLCIVESTDSLIHPMWQVVTQINGDGLTHAVADRHDEGSKQRFYRIRIE